MINKKNTTGGGIIGDGSYGCILRPNLKCGRFQPSNDYVSKVIPRRMGGNDIVQDEYHNLNKEFNLPSIDPNGDYFIAPIELCTFEEVNPSDLEIDKDKLANSPYYEGCPSTIIDKTTSKLLKSRTEADKAEGLKRLNSENANIIMPFGGDDIADLRKRQKKDNTLPSLHSQWNSYYNLIIGILKLNKNSIAHRDIKPPNILQYGDKMKLIDFGLANKTSNTWDDFDGTFYVYWPGDYYFNNAIYKLFERHFEGNQINDRIKKISFLIERIIKKGRNATEFDFSDLEEFFLIDDEHLKRSKESLLRFLINCKVDKLVNHVQYTTRTNETFDVYMLGAFFSNEFKKLASIDSNSDFNQAFKELIMKMTSNDPFERPLPDEILKEYIKLVKRFILPKSQHKVFDNDIKSLL